MTQRYKIWKVQLEAMGVSREHIVQRWFSELMSDAPVYGRAAMWLDSVIDLKPERAWEIILALIEHAPNEDALALVGAGPLEDLMCEHGPFFIDRVEEIAAINPRFKECLSHVWGWTRMDPPTYQRMRRAAGMDEA